MEDKLIKFDLGELIDKLSILQIKEMLLGADVSNAISDIEEDIDAIHGEHNIQLTPNLIRQIIVMAQANLHVWMLKDDMAEESDSDRYNCKLRLAQDFNNCLKNAVKNMYIKLFCPNGCSDLDLKATSPITHVINPEP